MASEKAIRHRAHRAVSIDSKGPSTAAHKISDSSQHPAKPSREAAVERKAQRDAEYKRLRVARQALALGKAEALMREAMPQSGMDRAPVLRSVSRLAGRELMADGCDLAMVQGRNGVIYHARPQKQSTPRGRLTTGRASEAPGSVWKVNETLIASCPPPFDLMTRPKEFAISVHTFIRSADNADAHGLLSMYSEESRRFTVDEVAFLGALASLLAKAFDSVAGPPIHAA